MLLEQVQEFMDELGNMDPNDEEAVANILKSITRYNYLWSFQQALSKYAEPLAKFLADIPEKDEDDIVAGNLNK